ncbi:MAG: hypothetical protein O3A01_08675 [bacterium]|nr:hypothetical protein [bacterium]
MASRLTGIAMNIGNTNVLRGIALRALRPIATMPSAITHTKIDSQVVEKPSEMDPPTPTHTQEAEHRPLGHQARLVTATGLPVLNRDDAARVLDRPYFAALTATRRMYTTQNTNATVVHTAYSV